MYLWALAIWAIFLGLAIPYVRRAKPPSARPFAAYLVFVAVFALCAAILFFGLTSLLVGLRMSDWLAHPVDVAVFLALVFVPAFLIARWQLRRPPRQPRAPPP